MHFQFSSLLRKLLSKICHFVIFRRLGSTHWSASKLLAGFSLVNASVKDHLLLIKFKIFDAENKDDSLRV